MSKVQFKTNINCSGCIQKVTPVLDKIEGIENWSVDTEDAQKVMTVETNSVSVEEIMTSVQNIGFNITKL